MIFINTRPVDENAQCERRPSKAPSHSNMSPHEAAPQMARLTLSLLLFYMLVSVFPCILFYPISLLSLVVPVLSIFLALCSMRRHDCNSNQWPFLLIAVLGILLKIAAIVVYIALFPVRDSSRRPPGFVPKNGKSEADMRHYRTVYYIILVAVEFFFFVVGGCLKWHLVAFEQREEIQKRRATLTSSRPLISDSNGVRRPSQS